MTDKHNEGLMDHQAILDSLISDCNEAVGAIAKGKYVLWCKLMYEMVQKLALVKNGIVNDLKSRDDIIASLKEQLTAVGIKVDTVSAERFTDADKITCQKSQPVIK